MSDTEAPDLTPAEEALLAGFWVDNGILYKQEEPGESAELGRIEWNEDGEAIGGATTLNAAFERARQALPAPTPDRWWEHVDGLTPSDSWPTDPERRAIVFRGVVNGTELVMPAGHHGSLSFVYDILGGGVYKSVTLEREDAVHEYRLVPGVPS